LQRLNNNDRTLCNNAEVHLIKTTMHKLTLLTAIAFLPILAACTPEATAPTEPTEPVTEAPAPEPKEEITQADYEAIENGMNLEQVEELLGEGEVISQVETESLPTYTTVQWLNPDGSNITLTLEDGLVTSKAQFGLK
jgi:hypothetical protein